MFIRKNLAYSGSYTWPAAFLADRGLAPAGVPTRWLWLAALAAGPLLLVGPTLLPDSASPVL
ncbi:MAG: hypothetical protein ACK2UP_09320, partial [Candidatus Promineifilaceae bacterium]